MHPVITVNEYLVFTYLFDKKHLLLSKFRVPNIITVGNTRVVRSADFGEESRLPTGVSIELKIFMPTWC